jgi:hypothetical protein
MWQKARDSGPGAIGSISGGGEAIWLTPKPSDDEPEWSTLLVSGPIVDGKGLSCIGLNWRWQRFSRSPV